jgi:hypothetical protein
MSWSNMTKHSLQEHYSSTYMLGLTFYSYVEHFFIAASFYRENVLGYIKHIKLT